MGIPMAADGYISVWELLVVKDLRRLNTTLDDLRSIVDDCPKQRFQLRERSEEEIYIRATQGHSMKEVKSEELLTPITLQEVKDGKYPWAIHGTYHKAMAEIQRSGGLSPMSRTHIHFSSQPFGSKDMISGMRSNAQVLLYADLEAAISAGHKFWISNNGVILCDSALLPLIYLRTTKTA